MYEQSPMGPATFEVTFRHFAGSPQVGDYALHRLRRLAGAVPSARFASVHITLEHVRAEVREYVVQVSLSAHGQSLHAEERGPSPQVAINLAHEALERRIRTWRAIPATHRRRRRPPAVVDPRPLG